MRFISLFLSLALLLTTVIEAQLPSDLTFVIADLKYSEAEGVKICELQQGSLSVFSGYDYLNGSQSYVQNAVVDFLQSWRKPILYLHSSVTSGLARILEQRGALCFASLRQLCDNTWFNENAILAPQDPSNLNDYSAIVIASPKTITSLSDFKNMYPGTIVLEAATYPYWVDKYKMTQLFTEDPILEAVKPSWGLFPKVYTPTLAQEIAEQLGANIFVIKPRSSFLGNGVMIVGKDNFDEILYKIIEKKADLLLGNNNELYFWLREKQDSFIVEKFYPSDPVAVPHMDNKLYDGTIRAVILLAYHMGEIQIDFVEMHWKLPARSITEGGTLNEVHKSIGKTPHFAIVAPEIQDRIRQQLSEALPRVYQRMLQGTEVPGLTSSSIISSEL